MCAGGCLCDHCCAKARAVGFNLWGLDRERVTPPWPTKAALVSKDGFWHHVKTVRGVG